MDLSRSYLARRIENHRPALTAHALSHGLPPDDAFDAVQDVVTNCLLCFDMTRGEEGLARYLYRSLHNWRRQWGNRRRAEERHLREWQRFQTELAEESLELLEMQGELRALIPLTPLTPRQEDCILAAIEGMTGRETAARLGISPSAVSQHRRAAIAHLALTVQRCAAQGDERGFRVRGEYVSFAALCRVVRYFPPAKQGTKLWRERWLKLS